MATAFAAAAARPRDTAERRFYRYMAWLMVALVFAGFAPSWFLRGMVPSPRPLAPFDATVIAHGVLCTLWLTIFWAQTQLVSAGRRDLHMRLGVAGMIVAVLMIPFMYLTMIHLPQRLTQPPGISPYGWMALPMGALLAYAPLATLGFVRRRDVQAHKRLMLSATLVFMGPAMGRIPLGPPSPAVFTISQVIGLLPFGLLFWWDYASRGRLHWASVTGAAVTGAGVTFGVGLMNSAAWISVAQRLPGG
ncbi:hypothetical protein LQ954_11290 [Sphingomonas sp. IC-11]|uniref:hypothetical protein n=1 Tax=Sphingomonas sp. IC-11 TaxID=2898528 RepID=UPI001E5DA11C|nr:hypothetical protein [Sphingomonas sp. IC-11]MCD2316732.1 hypothetical protein [Sphingomonas sp. IC-11]